MPTGPNVTLIAALVAKFFAIVHVLGCFSVNAWSTFLTLSHIFIKPDFCAMRLFSIAQFWLPSYKTPKAMQFVISGTSGFWAFLSPAKYELYLLISSSVAFSKACDFCLYSSANFWRSASGVFGSCILLIKSAFSAWNFAPMFDETKWQTPCSKCRFKLSL